MAASRILPLSDVEIALLRALVKNRVKFMIVGAGAAVVQGADLATKDLDLWFQSTSHAGVARAAQEIGASFVWRTTPQFFSGNGLEDIDVVAQCDGLGAFDDEFRRAVKVPLAPELVVRALPLERVLASKKAAGRPKDMLAIPALEAAIAVMKELRSRR